MAYIEWWNRTGPITLGERFGLNEISTRAKTLSPIKSYIEDRIDMKPGGIVEPGVTHYSTDMRGRSEKPKGLDSPHYKPLSVEGRKIAMHVYGTLDISDRQRKRINTGEITMDTKARKWKEGDISVKSKKGQPVTDVVFPNKEMKADFIKDLKLRAKQPMKAVIDYGNEWFADNYPISEKQLKRAIPYLINKHKIKYLEIEETPWTRYLEKRKSYLDVSSSELEEGRIREAKTKILKEKNLARKIDFGHRVSKRHMAALGLQFDTNLVGMDSRIINQVIIRPSEKKLDRLYRKQFKIFEQLKDNPTDELLKKELADINKQVKALVKTTSGRLVGVTIDPNTLESSFEGLKKKYSLTQFMNENITIKDLEKLPPAEQEKFLTKQLTKAVDAEIKKGFVPNDFKKILSDKKSQEALLKYAQKRAPQLIGKLKWAFKNPASKVSMKLLSSPFALIGAGYLTYKSGLLDTVVKADTLKEPSDETQEGSVMGDVAKGAGAIALGTAIVHPKETGELAKKVLTKAGKILAKPIALTALPFWKAKQVIGETIKSVKEKKLPDYKLTDPNTWMHAAFWNWAVKEWGLTKTLDQFSKANIPGKAKILSHVVARGGLNPNLVKFISSKVAWPATAAASVYDAYKDYQRRKPFIEEQKELIEQGVVKEEEFDKEEPMFAMGGIASLLK